MANISIVATGGTRAPTQLDLADRFLEDGHDVRLLATRAALRFLCSHMLRRPHKIPGYIQRYRPATREFLAYFFEKPKQVPHIAEAQWPDVIVMAPATCNSIGKLVAGMCDNFPLLVVRALPRNKRVIVVPSMNHEMWFDPYLQRNIDLLNATEKYRVVSPQHGQMLSGDHGFGAQASFDRIVAETYNAAGQLEPSAESLFSKPAAAALHRNGAVRSGSSASHDIVLVDRDQALRQSLVQTIAQEYPDFELQEFAKAADAMQWIRERKPSLLLTELETEDGISGHDLIEFCNRPDAVKRVHVIATSSRSRTEIRAEALAAQDVLFLPKPLNVPFAVGMIAGCLGGHGPPFDAKARVLEEGEFLFREGEESTEVFIVESGNLRVLKGDGDRQILLRTVGAGAMIGEIAFLTQSTRTASIVAAERTTLVALDLRQFRTYLERQPVWLRAMIDSLVRNVLDSDRAISTAAEAHVNERLQETFAAAEKNP